MSPMTGMMNTLFTSTHTPLYSATWTPSNTGEYAGTCLFIITLGIIFRALFSYRSRQEHKSRDAELNRRPVIVPGKKQDDDAARPNQKDIGAGKRKGVRSRLWRISTDVPRACLDTLITGVGYLLMLAVMTMNVGYFLSALGGTFLGSLIFGRYGIHFAP